MSLSSLTAYSMAIKYSLFHFIFSISSPAKIIFPKVFGSYTYSLLNMRCSMCSARLFVLSGILLLLLFFLFISFVLKSMLHAKNPWLYVAQYQIIWLKFQSKKKYSSVFVSGYKFSLQLPDFHIIVSLLLDTQWIQYILWPSEYIHNIFYYKQS